MPTRTKNLLILCFLLIGAFVIQTPCTTKAISAERAENITKSQQDTIESKKTVLLQRLQAEKESRVVKLESKRLEVCKTHEQKINSINSKNVEQNSKQLATFLKIENNTKKFYVNKGLSAEGYDSTITAADVKYADAVAAIEASGEINFNCETTDSTNPGSTIKEATTARHVALKEYKTAVKNLILIVKNANTEKLNQSKSTTSTEDK